MDDTSVPLDRSTPVSGGTVEPTQRAAADKVKTPSPRIETSERFELRDPFAEVTYNARTLDEMVSKAEQLGAQRFVAIDANGQRSFVEQNGGEWQRRPVMSQTKASEQDGAAARETATVSEPSRTEQATTVKPSRDDTKVNARSIAEAERATRLAQLETALQERYIIKRAPVNLGDVSIGRTEYRFRGDSSRVAFTESTFRLATETNSPSVARSMVDVAQTRKWSALRVSGHEDFKRMVWLEASVRGIKAMGYEPNPADLEVLRREREARQVNRIEAAPGVDSAVNEKPSGRGGGGRKAVLAAIDAMLIAKGVPDKKREAVMTAVSENLAQRLRSGKAPVVKIYARSASVQRPVSVATPEAQRPRERAHPVR